MSTAKRVIKNTMYLYIRMGVSIVLSFLSTRITLQALGASDYGLYNVLAGALSMLGFLSASLSSTTQRFISYAEGEGNSLKIKEIFNTAVFLHTCFSGIICLLFIFAGFFFFNGILNIPEGRESISIAVYGCMIFSTVFAITISPYDAILNAHENMKYYSILGIFDVSIKLAIAITILHVRTIDKLLLYGVLMAGESFLYRVLTKYYCKRHYWEVKEIGFRGYVKKDLLKEITSFAGWNLLNIASGILCLYGLNIIVNHYFGTTVNAAMGVATQLSGVLMGLTQNMTKALTPVLVKEEGAKQRERVLQIAMIGCRFSLIVFGLFCIPLLFCISPILELWLTEVPHFTIEFCRLMLISILCEQLFLFLQQAIIAEGNIKSYCITKSIFNLLPLPLTVIAFQYGYSPTVSWILRFVFFVAVGSFINYIFAIKRIHLSQRAFSLTVLTPCLLTVICISLSSYLIDLAFRFDGVLVILKYLIMLLIAIPIAYCTGLLKSEKRVLLAHLKCYPRDYTSQ